MAAGPDPDPEVDGIGSTLHDRSTAGLVTGVDVKKTVEEGLLGVPGFLLTKRAVKL